MVNHEWECLAVVPEPRGSYLLVFWGDQLVDRYNILAWRVQQLVPEGRDGFVTSCDPITCEDVTGASTFCVVEVGYDGTRRWIFLEETTFTDEAAALAHGDKTATAVEAARAARSRGTAARLNGNTLAGNSDQTPA